jgi:hypothetical protein
VAAGRLQARPECKAGEIRGAMNGWIRADGRSAFTLFYPRPTPFVSPFIRSRPSDRRTLVEESPEG